MPGCGSSRRRHHHNTIRRRTTPVRGIIDRIVTEVTPRVARSRHPPRCAGTRTGKSSSSSTSSPSPRGDGTMQSRHPIAIIVIPHLPETIQSYRIQYRATIITKPQRRRRQQQQQQQQQPPYRKTQILCRCRESLQGIKEVAMVGPEGNGCAAHYERYATHGNSVSTSQGTTKPCCSAKTTTTSRATVS